MTVATIYPPSAMNGRDDLDIINPDDAPTLPELFAERVRRTPDAEAYRDYVKGEWCSYTWQDIQHQIWRWQIALTAEGLHAGDNIALRVSNCHYWPIIDIAALGLGLVIVPLYVRDRPDNAVYILEHADICFLILDDANMWQEMLESNKDLANNLLRIVLLNNKNKSVTNDNDKVIFANEWLPIESSDNNIIADEHHQSVQIAPNSLASIMYTSGTTGRPKGVMLSHKNVISNAYNSMHSICIFPHDVFLSFLPLSHTLERMAGYYLPMMAGATVVYSRSVLKLADDLKKIKPTAMVAVPRIFERIQSKIQAGLADAPAMRVALFKKAMTVGWRYFEYKQGRASWHPALLLHGLLDGIVGKKVRAAFGGNLRLAICGGAALSPSVSHTFISLGVTIVQGYGLTESSPVIAVGTIENNKPECIGMPIHGVEVRIGDKEELLARGANIMLGYWKNEAATRKTIDVDGWLHSGDQASIDADGFLRITGRLKEIIVLANGEKVPPVDIEAAICEDPLFAQALVLGEAKAFLAAIVVLEAETWRLYAEKNSLDADDISNDSINKLVINRISERMRAFPGYAKIRKVSLSLDVWSIENSKLTPTLKLKRAPICQSFAEEIANMYIGH
ncbi:MAG: long-chain fatty acid--CoA ligase [Mariprofundales bacterium]